jgi:hypothetical protein
MGDLKPQPLSAPYTWHTPFETLVGGIAAEARESRIVEQQECGVGAAAKQSPVGAVGARRTSVIEA